MLGQVGELRPAQRQARDAGDPVLPGEPAHGPAPAAADVQDPPGPGSGQHPVREEVDLPLLGALEIRPVPPVPAPSHMAEEYIIDGPSHSA